MRNIRGILAACVVAVTLSGGVAGQDASHNQLEVIRSRIRTLEQALSRLDADRISVQQERQRLTHELELAEARVSELEIMLTASRDEVVRRRQSAAKIATELEARRDLLAHHLEMMALLGRPGPLQLLFDAARGGELEDAIGTVAVLTTAQVQLMHEYRRLQQDHNARLAELSRALQVAEREAVELVARRGELERVRSRVDRRLAQLDRTHRKTSSEIDHLKGREQALERLMTVVASKQRLTGNEDVRRYRGALPWPVEGRVVQGFGRRYQEKYSTYTVCNGLRLAASSGAEVRSVFPGIVAYARHFKGYGNMVVVDHGQDVYSLVAGLATIHVRVNQAVSMGSRLGLAAPPSDDGNVYVEFRVEGKPQDPRLWLQLEEG
jgi:septal ring factor EnvC (AmiA/AmiB activator)